MLAAARAWARGRPGLAAGLVLGLLIAVSAGARFAASSRFDVPWIAPDEMVYGLLGQDLWERGSLTIRGHPVPYHSLLYPAFVGLPLVAGGLDEGIRAAQAMQSVAIALAAVPVYLWGRRFLSRGWALGAAALTLATPALTYGGLLMTESLFYPATAAALAALARLLEAPTLARQGTFLVAVTVVAAVRLQGLVLLPALVGAAALFALLVRSPAALVRLWPLLAVLAAATAGTAAAVLVRPDTSLDDLLGAYAAGARPASTGVGWELVWHAGYVAILGAFVPALCFGTLVWRAVRAGEPHPPAAAFLATAASFVPLLAAQVALFAAENVDHVGGRYLVTALPPLALALCLWASRGAPWERVGTPVVAASLVVCVALTPVEQAAAANAAHDLLETLALRHLAGATSVGLAQAVLALAAALAVLAAALVSIGSRRRPERAAATLAVSVGVVLAGASALAVHDVARLSERAQTRAFGDASPRWIDENEPGATALLATGALRWTSNARLLFWNESVRRIVALPGAEWHGPLPVLPARLEPDGRVRTADGRRIVAPSVVVPGTLSLDGRPVAGAPQTADEPVKTLWRTEGPLRATIETAGFTPVGDFGGEPARVTVFGCTRGALGLTLLGKQGLPISISVNGIPLRTVTVRPEGVWRGSILAPPDADGTRPCVFVLESAGLVGSTRIEWIPPPGPVAREASGR